jgi:redox-regulated HSP33 family molecular chaperone
VNAHLAESEQRRGGFGAGVHVDHSAIVDAAGGWCISLLPGATDEVIVECVLYCTCFALREHSCTWYINLSSFFSFCTRIFVNKGG